jgi:phage gpG-like protein
MIEAKLKLDKRSSERVRKKLDQVQRAVSTGGKGGGGRGAGLERVNRKVSVWLLRWVNTNFKTQGGKVGGWKPFKYGGRVVSKTKKGKSGKRTKNRLAKSQGIGGPGNRPYVDTSAKLLQDTGLLRAKFHPFHTRNTAGVGNNQPYSLAHELGVPSRNLPARRMLPESGDRDVEDGVLKIYDTYIERIVRK